MFINKSIDIDLSVWGRCAGAEWCRVVAAGAEVTIHGDRKHPDPGPAPAADTELPASPRLLAREADIGLTLRPRHAAQVHRCRLAPGDRRLEDRRPRHRTQPLLFRPSMFPSSASLSVLSDLELGGQIQPFFFLHIPV